MFLAQLPFFFTRAPNTEERGLGQGTPMQSNGAGDQRIRTPLFKSFLLQHVLRAHRPLQQHPLYA